MSARRLHVGDEIGPLARDPVTGRPLDATGRRVGLEAAMRGRIVDCVDLGDRQLLVVAPVGARRAVAVADAVRHPGEVLAGPITRPDAEALARSVIAGRPWRLPETRALTTLAAAVLWPRGRGLKR